MATAESVEIVNRANSFRGVSLGGQLKDPKDPKSRTPTFRVELLGHKDPGLDTGGKARIKVPEAHVAEAIRRREELMGIGLEVVRV